MVRALYICGPRAARLFTSKMSVWQLLRNFRSDQKKYHGNYHTRNCRKQLDTETTCVKIHLPKGRPDTIHSYSPLNYAVLLDSISCIDLLLEYRAEVNRPAKNSSKRTVLQLAAELGHTHIVSHLINKGADVNAPPAPLKGLTALQLASRQGHLRIEECLIEHGANIDAPPARIHGRTAFEAATESGRLDIMLLLVRKGVELVTEFGEKQFEKAIEFAKAQDQTPAIKLAHELKEKILQARAEVEQEEMFPSFVEIEELDAQML